MAGAWLQPRIPSSAEFKERVELYFYSPCVPSWQVIGKNFTFIRDISLPPVSVLFIYFLTMLRNSL